MRGLQGTTEAMKLVVTVSLLFSMIGLANWIWNPTEAAQRDEVLQRRHDRTSSATSDHLPRADHDRRRDPRRDRAAALLYRTRAGIAMRAVGRRPPARGAQRRPPGPLVDARVGDRLLARRARRHPHRAHVDARRHAAVAAHRQRVRRRDHRTAAQPAADVPRRAHPRPADGLPARATCREEQPVPRPAFGSAVPVIVLFIVLLILPSPRLRGQASPARGSIFPMPTMRGTLIFSVVIVGGTALAIPLLTPVQHGRRWRSLFGIGIVALSLVPLIGLAGQISLCQLSFAGHRRDRDGPPRCRR